MIPPATSPMTVTIAKGTRNQVGRIWVSAPTGSAPMAVSSDLDDPARRVPKRRRNTGGSEDPRVVHHTTPWEEAERGRYLE
jgi:hypothetical protein